MKRIAYLLLALSCLLAVHCGTVRQVSQQKADVTLADSIWTFSQTRPDGFTLHLATWTEPTVGISVSYEDTQHSHGRECLEAVIGHAKTHSGHIGGWFNSSDSLYYFDSVRIFPEDSLSAAILFGREHHQIAIYRLSTGEEIYL
jgi:hypothetical protein